jgi:hypothetical protein
MYADEGVRCGGPRSTTSATPRGPTSIGAGLALVAMFCAPVRDGPELCGAAGLGISSRHRLGAIPPGQFRTLVDGRQ